MKNTVFLIIFLFANRYASMEASENNITKRSMNRCVLREKIFDDFSTYSTYTVDKMRKSICKAAAENDYKKLIELNNEYNRKIQSKIKSQKRTSNIKKLQEHAHVTRYSALYNAILLGNYESSKVLLVNLSADFFEHYNPKYLLHTVCFGNWHEDEIKTIEILELLLKAGADMNGIRNKSEISSWSSAHYIFLMETPLDVAMGKKDNYRKMVEGAAPFLIQNFLQQKGGKRAEELLYYHINYADYQASKELLLSLPSEFLHDKPNCLLHIVCFGRWHENEAKTIEILELLLKKGADINEIRKKTALFSHRTVVETPLDVALGNATRGFSLENAAKSFKAPPSIQLFLKQKGARCASEQEIYKADNT